MKHVKWSEVFLHVGMSIKRARTNMSPLSSHRAFHLDNARCDFRNERLLTLKHPVKVRHDTTLKTRVQRTCIREMVYKRGRTRNSQTQHRNVQHETKCLPYSRQRPNSHRDSHSRTLCSPNRLPLVRRSRRRHQPTTPPRTTPDTRRPMCSNRRI